MSFLTKKLLSEANNFVLIGAVLLQLEINVLNRFLDKSSNLIAKNAKVLEDILLKSETLHGLSNKHKNII